MENKYICHFDASLQFDVGFRVRRGVFQVVVRFGEKNLRMDYLYLLIFDDKITEKSPSNFNALLNEPITSNIC